MALASLTGYDKLKVSHKDEMHEIFPRATDDPATAPFGLEYPRFSLPPGIPPRLFVEQHFGANSRMQFLHGTTTLAFTYEAATPADKGGIIVAVDSRASSGVYVSSKTVNKVLDCTDRLVATMAGGAADCQFWIRQLAKQCHLFELKQKVPMSTAAASKLLSNMLYNYAGMGLSVGSSVAGFDKWGPSIYYVDDDGKRIKGKCFSIGSGSLNAYGILDTYRKEKMTDQEARALAEKAIVHATFRDTGSGGYVTVVHITADSKTRFPRKDVSELHYEYRKAKGDAFDLKDVE